MSKDSEKYQPKGFKEVLERASGSSQQFDRSGFDALGVFTPRAQQAVALARKEAIRLKHTYVGTEHILLGIIKLGQGVAWNVLRRLGFNIETFSLEMEKGVGPCCYTRGFVPNTDKVEKIFEFASKEAKALGHTYVGTEHLLLGILEEGDGLAARVLRDLCRTDIDVVRQAVLKKLDPNYNTEGASEVAVPRNEKVTWSYTVSELASQFLDLVEGVIPISGLNNCDPRRLFIFAHLRLLLRVGYNFSGMSLELVLRLVCLQPTIEELMTLCSILNFKYQAGSGGLVELQTVYDQAEPGSAMEIATGRMIQVWSNKLPRKLGPEVDRLADVRQAIVAPVIEVEQG